MINIYLFISIAFLLVLIIGRWLEKLRVPWIFAALILGAILAINNTFSEITNSEIFENFARIGMYLLLFLIGLEINLNQVKKRRNFIIKATFVIIFLEGFVGSLFIHYFFHYSWLISFIVAMSFATVGEAILVPILDEFKIINTRLGQSIIGIGVLDDIIEMLMLIIVILLINSNSQTPTNLGLVVVSLLAIFVLTLVFIKFKKESNKFKFVDIENVFLFVMFVFFLFLGIGEFAEATSLAALFAGISVRQIIPKKRFKLIESEIKTMCYGFFAPIFFVWVGASMDIDYLFAYPALVFLVILVSKSVKIFGSILVGRKELGMKESILLGIGISVRFSTSIIIIKILYENGLVNLDLYSIIIASSIVFKFIVPLLFSKLITHWKINQKLEI